MGVEKIIKGEEQNDEKNQKMKNQKMKMKQKSEEE